MEHTSMSFHHTYVRTSHTQCVCYLLLSHISFEMPAWVLAVLCNCLSQSERNCSMFHTFLHVYYYIFVMEFQCVRYIVHLQLNNCNK